MTTPEMKLYYLVLLYGNEAYEAPADGTQSLLAAHLAYGQRLHEQQQLHLSGPMKKHSLDTLEGIYILEADSLEEAERLAADDPAVKAGALQTKVYEWYAPLAMIREWAAQLEEG